VQKKCLKNGILLFLNLKPVIMTTNKLYLICISAVIALGSSNGKNPAAGDQNTKKDADTTSGAHSAVSCVCAGMLQSPINIVERTTIPVVLPKLTFVDTATKMYIQNDKKAIKVAPLDPVNNRNYLIFNNQKYDLKDFHFHHKSEHLFNGLADSMEMHVVYQNKQTKAIVAVGLLISMGKDPNPVLSAIWKEFPAQGNYEPKNLINPVNISRIIRYSDADTYYSYVGSLTTPEYAEGVAWTVLKRRLVLNAAQIKQFAAYYPDNARDTLPINNRFVFRTR
jgi:carbonic anhydrase